MSGKAAAKPGATKTAKSKSAGKVRDGIGRGLWVGGLCIGGLIVLVPGSALLLAGLMAPMLLIAVIPDVAKGTRLTHITLLFGLAATVHPLRTLWTNDTGWSAALAMLRQPMILLPAWTAVFGGWLVSELVVLIMRLHADISAARYRRTLMSMIEQIEEEWGPMPASAPLPPL